MKLTPPQVSRFWREWAKSSKVMGWTRSAGLTAAQIDEKRKEFLAKYGFRSLTEVDRTEGFTKVLNELLVLQGTSIKAGIESEDKTLNDGRIQLNLILTDLIPCLELYVEDVQAYISEIMETKNRWWRINRPARGMTLLDLDNKPVVKRDKRTGELREFPSPLKQMVYTLSARLNVLRNKAGHSIHDMRIAAGLECSCAVCCKAKIRMEAAAFLVAR